MLVLIGESGLTVFAGLGFVVVGGLGIEGFTPAPGLLEVGLFAALILGDVVAD